MECSKIRELLSEYIDDALDKDTRALVEEHLRSCRTCSEELVSMKACIENLAPLKEIKAPEGFLEAVRERIERPSVFERLMRKLFVPLKIKIPLEAIAVAASVMFIITMFRSGGISTLDQAVKAPLKKEGAASGVTTLQRPAAQKEIYYAEDVMDRGLAGASREMMAEKPTEITLVTEGKVINTHEEMENLVRAAGGAITDIEYDDITGLPQYVTVQIPADNYNAFIQNVGRIGMLTGPFPTATVKGKGSVVMRIRYI